MLTRQFGANFTTNRLFTPFETAATAVPQTPGITPPWFVLDRGQTCCSFLVKCSLQLKARSSSSYVVVGWMRSFVSSQAFQHPEQLRWNNQDYMDFSQTNQLNHLARLSYCLRRIIQHKNPQTSACVLIFQKEPHDGFCAFVLSKKTLRTCD